MNLLLKAKYSFYSTLVFFLCANPETYKLINKVLTWVNLNGTVANPGGCPTPLGLFLNSILFFCVILALMMFPRD
jgi:hypothetical protein